MFYIYILKSEKNNSFYIGSCKDVNVRLKQHNGGLVKSTKRYVPWILIYSENYLTLKEARKRELQIKSWKKRKKIEIFIKDISKFNSRGSSMALVGP